MLRKLKINFLLTSLFSFILNSQASIDSLKTSLASATGRQLAIALTELGFKYIYINTDSALFYANKGIVLAKQLKNQYLYGHGLNNLGTIYLEKNDFTKALDNYISAEKVFQESNDSESRVLTIMNIGIVYEYQSLYEKAEVQYNIALNLAREIKNIDYQAQILNHLGSLYYSKNNKSRALENFEETLKLNQQINNIPRTMECLNNIAVIYQEMGKYSEALQNFNTDLEYARKMSIKTDIIAILHNIGLVYKDKKDYTNAVSYIDSSIYIAKEIRDFNNLREAYSTLSEIYKEQNNYIKALEFFQLSSAAKDSLLSQTREKQFIEMSTKYETEKKESENKLLKAEGEKQKTILIAITGGFILMLALAFFVYRGYRQKKKANIMLAAQNREIKNQKQIIEEKQTEILDSITYAKRLQDAILPPVSLLEKHLNVFVYYQPKDIVAGDFYWMETVTAPAADCILIAAADCTGHGVPGAMVSVVCSNALNRAVHEFNLTDPGQILDKTRELVLKTFAKSERNVKDGMDISLCAIHRSQDKISMKWAGANNPVYIISNSRFNEIKGDKFPVGAFIDKQDNFKSHSVDLLKGDRIFIFSDGLPDQFGGPKNKKYKYQRLQEKLMESCALGIEQQRRFMENDLLAWKGSHEQVDDILLMGFEV